MSRVLVLSYNSSVNKPNSSVNKPVSYSRGNNSSVLSYNSSVNKPNSSVNKPVSYTRVITAVSISLGKECDSSCSVFKVRETEQRMREFSSVLSTVIYLRARNARVLAWF